MTLEMHVQCLCKRLLPLRPTAAMRAVTRDLPKSEKLWSVYCKCGRQVWIFAADVQHAREVVDARMLSA